MNIDFDVILDDIFIKVATSEKPSNHHLVTMLNDFEEGEWRLKKFMNCIWNNIAETALTEKEKRALINDEKYYEIAERAALNLRLTDNSDIGQGSEIAEILLYAIMKHYFGAISAVPKIFYKQNNQDNAKGADSVHIVIKDNKDFSLWLGEAKFYTNFDNSRFDGVIDSIRNQLNPEKLRKENTIITNVSNLDDCISDQKLVNKIKEELSAGVSIDLIKSKLHIPILILHECNITKNFSEYSVEYQEKIKSHHLERAKVYFDKQRTKLTDIYHYQRITFHLILFPVPNKQQIVEQFSKKVHMYREN